MNDWSFVAGYPYGPLKIYIKASRGSGDDLEEFEVGTNDAKDADGQFLRAKYGDYTVDRACHMRRVILGLETT